MPRRKRSKFNCRSRRKSRCSHMSRISEHRYNSVIERRAYFKHYRSKSTLLVFRIAHSHLQRRISDLLEIDSVERDKAIKLLRKILNNILNNPSNTKYADLNFRRICIKFEQCQPAFYLFYEAGFKQSRDGKRLQIALNDNVDSINKVNDALECIQNEKSISTKHQQVKHRYNQCQQLG